jgi:heme exporter protein D
MNRDEYKAHEAAYNRLPGQADSFAGRHPILAWLAIVGYLIFVAAAVVVTVSLEAKINSQVEQDARRGH